MKVLGLLPDDWVVMWELSAQILLGVLNLKTGFSGLLLSLVSALTTLLLGTWLEACVDTKKLLGVVLDLL